MRTEIGLGLTGFGIFFSFLGIIFFFDKGLLAMGNVSYFVLWFLVAHSGNDFRVLWVRCTLQARLLMHAMCSGFWPTLAVFVQKIPVIGWVFQQPYIRSFFDRYRSKRFSPVSGVTSPSFSEKPTSHVAAASMTALMNRLAVSNCPSKNAATACSSIGTASEYSSKQSSKHCLAKGSKAPPLNIFSMVEMVAVAFPSASSIAMIASPGTSVT
ncbi:hypothetical protein RJ640_023845 [Escallonia rubra]|uniref:Uncharacterized protein n=1 Tax=Escallonia rubra TaxID=112253 RepID=A0AA88UN10_9ASTE|nr:hypothetical protein RJ640_023845 [Escallonia rubra]